MRTSAILNKVSGLLLNLLRQPGTASATSTNSHELFVHVCFGLVAYAAPPSGGAAMNGGERKRLKLANKQPLAPLKVPLSKQNDSESQQHAFISCEADNICDAFSFQLLTCNRFCTRCCALTDKRSARYRSYLKMSDKDLA